MRPTREGRISPNRPGLIFRGIGVDPDAPTTDPEPPVDRATDGIAYVPFLSVGDAGVVQYKTAIPAGGGSPVTVTLDSTPTIGNVLVLMIAVDDDSGPSFTIGNGTWTQVGSTVYSGNGTNWPNRMYYQVVTGSTSAATTIDSTGGATDSGHLHVGIVELSAVDTVDADVASATNTATTSDSVTPTAGQPAVALSATFGRNGSVPALAAAGGMTEFAEVSIGGNRPYGLNYQVIATTAGSYTLGSTGAAANSSMIGAIFRDTGVSLNWIEAPLTIDGDDATYDYSYDSGIEEFWRIDLGDTYLVDSISARLAYETAGSNPIIVQGANAADYSDATTVATIPFTATGSFTAEDVTDSWTPSTAYRYWQLVQTTEDDVRIHTVELLTAAAGGGSGGTTIHGLLTGRTADDQHPASAVTVTDTGGWFAGGDVEEVLDELAAKAIGYEAHGSMGATETFDAAIGWHSGTLNANCTFTLTAAPSGTQSSLFLELLQDGTGGWTITLPASVVNKADIEADQDTTAARRRSSCCCRVTAVRRGTAVGGAATVGRKRLTT